MPASGPPLTQQDELEGAEIMRLFSVLTLNPFLSLRLIFPIYQVELNKIIPKVTSSLNLCFKPRALLWREIEEKCTELICVKEARFISLSLNQLEKDFFPYCFNKNHRTEEVNFTV